MGLKLKDWRHLVKIKLNIIDDDTLETVRMRMGQNVLSRYDPLNMDAMLDKWYSKKIR
jgi:hypothetical protein